MKNLDSLLNGPHQTQLAASQNLRNALKGSQAQLGGLHNKLTPSKSRQRMSKYGIRALKWPLESKEVDKILQELNRYTGLVTAALEIDEMNTLLRVDDNIVNISHNIATLDQKTVLSQLPLAKGASFDSHAEEHNPTCLPDTRVDLLRQIEEWAQNPTREALFWLNGVAGTGKSTISRTLARSSSDRGQLGASFFFKRDEVDRSGASKFFTTIASQLVQREPALAPHVKEAIDADPAIVSKSLQEQFDKLILEPLSKISSAHPKDNILIVIDALDECDQDNDIKRIIHLLSKPETLKLQRLRIFLTSRPEVPIRLGFQKVQDKYEHLVLHEIAELVVEHDISTFFQHELAGIRHKYNESLSSKDEELSQTWPGESKLATLVKMAVPLFIFASTVCRFIDDDTGFYSPNERLEKILAFRDSVLDSELDKIDATYRPMYQ
ncbi:hypothetical protein ONZ43_g1455 [Nemania bipapillata]|uniref:Uncharacterized protein n=1 Tax=Nemania bipapillata TaxID=110536 RepID=A0ACC2J4K9_9PEZI|nr:hypothetical protein ONZ43_g1455 [Nemania bipapillata]